MITEMFGVIKDAIGGFIECVGQAINSVTDLFYTAGEAGASGSFTFLGTLLLITAGVGLVYWAIRLIRRLVASRA